MFAAYGQLGSNATAHDLALGLLLVWLPVLILTTIVDRNPTSPHATRLKLNQLVEAVRLALLNPHLRDTYLEEADRLREDLTWTNAFNAGDDFRLDFFEDFAGQGRIRWHYGVAHPIIAGIEDAFVADHGRDWLRHSQGARVALISGPPALYGLRWFDFRELWQIWGSLIIVAGSAVGAFIVSYFTPTVGLGCRSGGYVIFVIIAVTEFALELLIWWLIPETSTSDEDLITRMGTRISGRILRRDINTWSHSIGTQLHSILSWWQSLSTRNRLEMIILVPMEFTNTAWLIYIILAQTVGSYRNCECMSSKWDSVHGGYLDFESYDFYRASGVRYYWGFGTATSGLILVVSFAFILAEWCTQSHLSSADYQKARSGLKWTRRFKKYTLYIRDIPNGVIELAKILWQTRCFLLKKTGPGRRSLVWTSRVKAQLARRSATPFALHEGLDLGSLRSLPYAAASAQPPRARSNSEAVNLLAHDRYDPDQQFVTHSLSVPAYSSESRHSSLDGPFSPVSPQIRPLPGI